MILHALISKFCSRFVLVGKSIKNTMLFHVFAKHLLKTSGFCTFYAWLQCGGIHLKNGCFLGNGHAPTNSKSLKRRGFWRCSRPHIKNQLVFALFLQPGPYILICVRFRYTFGNNKHENTWKCVDSGASGANSAHRQSGNSFFAVQKQYTGAGLLQTNLLLQKVL